MKYVILIGVLLLTVGVIYYALKRPPFPNTLLINLESRKDRLENVLAAFSHWPVKPERIDAIKATPGWKGCTLSHLKCIETAKSRGYPWVLYIEDDCYMTRSGLRQFMDVLPYLWANRDKWDIFSGATSKLDSYKKMSSNPPLFQVTGYASHFVLVNGAAYDKIVGAIDKNAPPVIDHYYKWNVRIWTTAPYIALQAESKSDIQEGVKNYDMLFKKSEKTLLAAI
jgi:GR25 family glycosyltransferase involved in LPS biosynthesis